jgi:hypothetical protein
MNREAPCQQLVECQGPPARRDDELAEIDAGAIRVQQELPEQFDLPRAL